MMVERETDVEVNAPEAMPVVPVAVLPVLVGEEMGAAVSAYRKVQAELDKALPECVMSIRGKVFRKKEYWRAVRVAFNLDVVRIEDERFEADGDWGYRATYRATAPNGARADGDGLCCASEKRSSKGEIIATEHNVRAHAHTRAMNRAISNLVGFGEVSAEEVYAEPARIDHMLELFREIGVTVEQIEGLLGHPAGDATADQVDRLRSVYKKIKRGEASICDFATDGPMERRTQTDVTRDALPDVDDVERDPNTGEIVPPATAV